MDIFSPFSVPKSWSVILLSDVLSNLETGKRPKGGVKDYTEGVVSLGGEHLNSDGGFKLDNIKFVPNSFAKKIQRAKVNINDILIVKDGATTGKASFIDDSFPFLDAVINEHIFVCRCFLDINSKYVFYFLYSQNGNKQILLDFRGAAQGGISRGFVEKAMIPLPPLNEQKRIVTKIEVLQTRSTAVKEELKAIKPLLNQFRQSVLAAAFRGDLTKDWREQNPDVEPAEVLLKRIRVERRRRWEETELEKMKAKGKVPKDDNWKKKYKEPKPIDTEDLPELPIGWCWSSLAECFELQRGRFSVRPRNDPSCYNGSYPFIQIGDLPREGGRIQKYSQTLNEKGLSVSRMLPKGSVLIAIVGATIGNTGILDFDSCCPDSLVAIQSNDTWLSQYIEYFMRSRKIIIRKVSYSSGGQPNINLQTLNPYPFPLPKSEEQKEIVRRIESLFKLVDSIQNQQSKIQNQIETLNQSILAKAFRGELVPQDPNDEPASVLLERIRAERDKAKPKKSKTEKKRSSKTQDKQLGIPGI